MPGPFRTHVSRITVLTALFGVLVFCASLFLFFEPGSALAQTPFEQLGEASRLPQTDLITIIARLIRVFLSVLGILFVLLILYAGYLYMVSQGDPAKTEKARKIISQAVVGFIIIMASYGITTFVMNLLLKATGGQGIVQAPVERYAEPLGSALGAGIIDNHYPPRNALDIPRNTKIFLTFKEAMDPTTLIQGDGELNANNILIFETSRGKGAKLDSAAVRVVANEDRTVFVFDPVELLGNPTTDVNYTVALQPGLKKANGKNAFVGAYASGYGWTFEVSTVVDLTPPKVVTVIPRPNAREPRNVSVELTFNEAMDPVSSTGAFLAGRAPRFTNIAVADSNGETVEGTYTISNNYRTVGLTTTDSCGQDPCGETIFCLPSGGLSVRARAATINATEIPQAVLVGAGYDGLTDAAGNSLDGNGNGVACGSDANNRTPELKAQLGGNPTGELNCPEGVRNDDYAWNFTTTEEIEDTVPHVTALDPEINEGEIDVNAPLEMVFNTLLLGSSINSRTVSLWPDPLYEMWFVPGKRDDAAEGVSRVFIEHPAFISNAEGGYEYYPVITHGVKSAYQICMYPSTVEQTACNGADSERPYCCNGVASREACVTARDQQALPPLAP